MIILMILFAALGISWQPSYSEPPVHQTPAPHRHFVDHGYYR